MAGRLALVLAALWWGSLSGLGLVVPMLFAHLPTPQMAGAMAARLFTAQTSLSVVCGLVLLMIVGRKQALSPESSAQAAIKFIVAGLLLALLVEFAAAPRIVAARVEGGSLRLWHGIGSGMLIGQWLCALGVLWQLGRPASARPD